MRRDPCSRSTFGGLGIFSTPTHLANEMFAATSVRATHDSLGSRARTHAHARGPSSGTAGRAAQRLIAARQVTARSEELLQGCLEDAVDVSGCGAAWVHGRIGCAFRAF